MQRICRTLTANGYSVALVGRVLPHSKPLGSQDFTQHRLYCRSQKGFLFYAEFNFRLFFWLLRRPCDAVCSVDLDTLPAGCLATLLRGKKRVFDAHEYFTEVPEVVHRPVVKAVWKAVGRLFLRFYRHAYTVGPALAAIFSKKYGIPFAVVRNVPNARPAPAEKRAGAGLLYQGALNAGRGIEASLQALAKLSGIELRLAGEGDLSAGLRRLARELGVEKRAHFLGYVEPADLTALTEGAWLGLNLLENKGLSYYYSLANKFFDYVQAGVPVLTMDFPEYRALNAQHPVAVLLPTLTPEAVAQAVQGLQDDKRRYEAMQAACRAAREDWTWEKEEAELLRVWRGVFSRI